MGEDSSGIEYEPHSKEEGVSDSELSLESVFSVDEGLTIHIRGDEGRSRSVQGEGA